jgi:RNA polymerase sigma factor (sigma-70 family)
MSKSSLGNEIPHAAVFVTTHWSVVLEAGGGDSKLAQAALEQLCRTYWYPIYYFVRRQGASTEDAQDLTQEFFARMLKSRWVASADPSRGMFRTFILFVLKRFLNGQWRRANAQKRSPGLHAFLPLPLDSAETRYVREPADLHTPEEAFEKQWALALLDKVLVDLGTDYQQDGHARLFEVLKPALVGSSEKLPYAKLALALNMPEVSVRVAVHRLRERYRKRLKAEVAHTVASPADVEDELRHLFRVLTRTR